LHNQLNPDVTVRSQGVMEKCTFCVQRIRRAERVAAHEGRALEEDEVQTDCAETCPTSALIFGDLNNPNGRVAQLRNDHRAYLLFGELGTEPSVTYLMKVDRNAPESTEHA
jgi:molybdopterin-containing oxidoreductase family iron-sulfur binding subunit